MATTSSTLQVAQILADLNDLQNTDPSAATSLLAANKTTTAKLQRRRSRPSIFPERQSFDKLGRRITGLSSRTASFKRFDSGVTNGGSTTSRREGVARMDSSLSEASSRFGGDGTTTAGSLASEGFRTPLETPGEGDEDMTRARTLVELYEVRGKMKQWGDTGLMRAKARVDEVVERYKKKEVEERERATRTVY